MLAWALQELSACSMISEVFVVVGAHADAVGPHAVASGARAVSCEDWARGMTASLRCAVAEAKASAAPALLVCAVDQPAATRAHFTRLIEHFRAGATVVASSYENVLGIPALFSSVHFAELASLTDDARGKDVVERHRNDSRFASEPLALGMLDVDTPGDLEQAKLAFGREIST